MNRFVANLKMRLNASLYGDDAALPSDQPVKPEDLAPAPRGSVQGDGRNSLNAGATG